MNRAEKTQQIAELHEVFARVGDVFLVDMTGLKVPEVTELRRKIKAAAGSCRVVKNRLAARAVAGTQAGPLAGRFKGPISIVSHASDPITLAKILTDFRRDHPQLQVRAASVSGRMTEAPEVVSLAALPGFNELRARLLGILVAPASTLVRLLATPGSQLARALGARREGMEGGAD